MSQFKFTIPFSKKQKVFYFGKIDYTILSLAFASTRVAMVLLMMFGIQSETFNTLFKDAAHIWIGVCLCGWLACKSVTSEFDIKEFYASEKYWYRSFKLLCCLEVAAAAATIVIKHVQS